MRKTVIDLCGSWKLAVLMHGKHKDYTTASKLIDDGIEVMPVTVPGAVESDLHANGKVDDLFFGTNPDKIRRYTERLHCYYFTSFNTNRTSGNPTLLFEGLDCYADIYLNGVHVASTDNMLIEHTVDISQAIISGDNELFIDIRPAVIEALKYEYPFMVSAGPSAYEQLYVRKPAHMFGWDIMPRYVSAGIWRPVSLVYTDAQEGIDEFYLCTAFADREKAVFEFSYKTRCDIVGDVRLKLEGDCDDSHFEEEFDLVFPYGRKKLVFKNPLLWWPRNFGKQNRYNWKITLTRDGEIIEQKCFKQGIAHIRLDYTPTMDSDQNGRFQFYVNEEKIFVKGTNWVAASPFHYRDKDRIPQMLDLAAELECNMIRCWGGNVYEDNLFYELCEEKGIMVWQDFGMACGKHPLDNDFKERIRKEAVQVVKRLRGFACIALWSGDNEGDLRWHKWEGIKMNPDRNTITRELLPEVVMLHDTARTYLPSSPFICAELINDEEHKKFMPENHFYIWGEFYKEGCGGERRSRFISEFGCISMPSPESAQRFLSAQGMWNGKAGTDEWNMHSTAPIYKDGDRSFRLNVPFMYAENMFKGAIEDYCDLAVKSQIAAGEGDKHFFEYFRSQKWDKTGMMWWNLIDGWPQLSDAVVDYYFDRKYPFYTLGASMQNVCIMMGDCPDGKAHPLVVANDTLESVCLEYRVINALSDEVLSSGTVTVEANSNKELCPVKADDKARYIFIEWYGDVSGQNHYLDFNSKKEKLDINDYITFLRKTRLYSEWIKKVDEWKG